MCVFRREAGGQWPGAGGQQAGQRACLPLTLELSEAGQDFLQKLLVVDPKERYTASQALEHPWIRDAADAPGAVDPAPGFGLADLALVCVCPLSPGKLLP